MSAFTCDHQIPPQPVQVQSNYAPPRPRLDSRATYRTASASSFYAHDHEEGSTTDIPELLAKQAISVPKLLPPELAYATSPQRTSTRGRFRERFSLLMSPPKPVRPSRSSMAPVLSTRNYVGVGVGEGRPSFSSSPLIPHRMPTPPQFTFAKPLFPAAAKKSWNFSVPPLLNLFHRRAPPVVDVEKPASPARRRLMLVAPWEALSPPRHRQQKQEKPKFIKLETSEKSKRRCCALPSFPKSSVEKKPNQRSRKHCCIILLLLLIIIYLLVNAVLVDSKLLGPAFRPTSTDTDERLTTCLSLFEILAPSQPLLYPCDTCLPPLSARNAAAHALPLQFCALRALFDVTANNATVNPLTTAGWFRDAEPCGWGGLACGNNSRLVNAISLTAPAVPTLLPTTLVLLTSLTSLTITGANALPRGPIPPLISPLVTLKLLNTGLTGNLPPSLLTNALQVLQLVNNSALGATLPPQLGKLPNLQSLSVTNQGLSGPQPLSLIFNSALTSKLISLDLSNNQLSGVLPDLSGFKNLQSLQLNNNALAGFLPSAFPPSLTSLGLGGNPLLSGSLPGSVCTSTGLKSCVLAGSAGVNRCGVCA